jgi:isopentenyldiphosphate isomerase
VSEELVDVVDGDDRIVGTVTRADVRARLLLHRVASTMVFRSDGRLLVHRRTETKDVFPGMYDCFVSGVVGAGESYERARDRELAEEMAIESASPVELFAHRFESAEDRSLSRVYAVTWDGPVVPQSEEISWHGWEPVERVRHRVEQVAFVPDGREVFLRWIAEGRRMPPGAVGSRA